MSYTTTFDKDLTPEEILEHFGTKGMKWGVRKAQVSTAARGATKGVKKTVTRENADKAVAGAKKTANAADRVIAKNKIGKGKTVGNLVLFGPLAIGTIPVANIRKTQKSEGRDNRVGKGGKAVHIILGGPLALATIPAQNAYQNRKKD